jgi:hypothetical protein
MRYLVGKSRKGTNVGNDQQSSEPDKEALRHLPKLILVSAAFAVVLFYAATGVVLFLIGVLWPPLVIHDAWVAILAIILVGPLVFLVRRVLAHNFGLGRKHKGE